MNRPPTAFAARPDFVPDEAVRYLGDVPARCVKPTDRLAFTCQPAPQHHGQTLVAEP